MGYNDQYMPPGRTVRYHLDPATGEFVPDEQVGSLADLMAMQQPSMTAQQAGTTLGSLGNTKTRYVTDPETGELVQNMDYVPLYSPNDPSVRRVGGMPQHGGQLAGRKDAINELMAKVAAMSSPGYSEEHPDAAYSSRTYRQGVPNIKERPEYKQLMDLLGVAKPQAEIGKLNAEAIKARGEGSARPESTYDKRMAEHRADVDAARMTGTKPNLAVQEEKTRTDKLRSIIQENAETALESVKIANPKIGWFSTGLPGQILSNVGGTDAKDLEEALRPIKALTGFDKLQELREMSKTGGALGQVAVEELRFLQSVKGSLETAQSEDQFRQILGNVEKYYEGKRANGANAGKSKAQIDGERQFAEAKGLPPEGAVRRIR